MLSLNSSAAPAENWERSLSVSLFEHLFQGQGGKSAPLKVFLRSVLCLRWVRDACCKFFSRYLAPTMKQCFIWPARTHRHLSVYKLGHIKYDMIISLHSENNREIKAFIVWYTVLNRWQKWLLQWIWVYAIPSKSLHFISLLLLLYSFFFLLWIKDSQMYLLL